MTTKPQTEGEGKAAANRARQLAMTEKKRKDAGEGTIKPVRAADDPPLVSEEFQAEFRALRKTLSDAGIEADASFMAMDSADATGGYIGELIIPFAKFGIPALAITLAAWFTAKGGRKVRVKIGDVEVEASTKETLTNEEFEKLLRRALNERAEKSGDSFAKSA
jgi:DNA-directed RNA polymerase subunit K/omega